MTNTTEIIQITEEQFVTGTVPMDESIRVGIISETEGGMVILVGMDRFVMVDTGSEYLYYINKGYYKDASEEEISAALLPYSLYR